ncbi:hypothetical protein GpartN1_g6187.t1 [Galdieria partita]|uniref:Uncharacterized protein n=1 Tax=Galdieria partita TaxID=83374 RepID=A0A9C7USU3_9RHOD|nr:hypothetical protein GpartN1_g6187.t1 [Galdieria partita]
MASREVSPLEGTKPLGFETVELQGELSLPSPPRRKPQNVAEDSNHSPFTVDVPKKPETAPSGNFLGLHSPSFVPESKYVNKASRVQEGTFRQRAENDRQRCLEELEKVDEVLKQKKELLEAKQMSLEYKRRWLLLESEKRKSLPNGKCLKSFTSQETLLDSVIKKILSENRLRAASSHAALQPFFCQVFDEDEGLCERGVFASYPPVSLYSAPEEILDIPKVVESFPYVKAKLSEFIRDKCEQKMELRKKLLEHFMELRDKWIKQLRTMEEQLSKEQTEALLQRDCYILIATQGSDVLLARTGSGRTTYRSTSNDTRNISLEDVGVFLNAIEADGGTAGGRSRWGKCLARIPCQDTSETPFEGGSVLLDDPLSYHHASCAINPWTNNELNIFIKRYAQYGKNFRKIASFLKYKTTEDVVRFYFQNKIRLQLKKYFRGCDIMSKRRMSRKNSFTQNNKLVSDFSWSVPPRTVSSSEVNLFDNESSACKATVHVDSGRESSRSASPISSWTFEEVEMLVQGLKKHGTNFKLIAKEIGTKTAMQCRAYWKNNRSTLNMDLSSQTATGEVQEPKVERKRRRRKTLEWSEEEKDAFEKYFQTYGYNWDRIAELIPTKTSLQIRTYYEELMAASRLDLEAERVSPSVDLHSSTNDASKDKTSTENAHMEDTRVKIDSCDKKDSIEAETDSQQLRKLGLENVKTDISGRASGESNGFVDDSPSQSISATAQTTE